jgi:RNA polymerase sigma factor (sigma-70 family)
LREIGRHRLLTATEEVELGQTMEAGREAKKVLAADQVISPQRRDDLMTAVAAAEEAADRLVCANLRLVVSVAKRYRTPDQALADAIADGNLGLLKAVERYDWRPGFKFSTYATLWIRQAVSRGGTRSRRALTMSASTDQHVRSVYRARAQLEEVLGRSPTVDELASSTQLSRALVMKYLALGVPPVSLDAPATNHGDGSGLDIAAVDAREPLDEISAEMATEEVGRLLDRLGVRDRRILELRFGLGGTPPHTYAEVARLLGTTPGRVRQLELRIFSRLRRTTLGQGAQALLAS